MAFKLVEDVNACRAEASTSGAFDKAVYESCMIRKGFQKTGDNSYSRSTGISPAVAIGAATALVPVLGSVLPTVTNVAEKIGAKPGPTVTTKASLPAPQPAAPSPAPSGGGIPIDPKTLLLIGGAAIIFLFAMRR